MKRKHKNMVYLALKTGYTFKKVFGHLDNIISHCEKTGYVSVADLASTYSHAIIEQKLTENEKLRPVYGVRLTVVENAIEKITPRGQFGCEYIFIAKNQKGLAEIYKLTQIFYDNFYYRGNISIGDVAELSKNVIVIAENFDNPIRIDYIALTQSTPLMIQNNNKIPKVAIINNDYIKESDVNAYQLFTFPRDNENKTYAQHILTSNEWRKLYKNHPEREKAINNTHKIAEECCHTKLKKADLVKYNGNEKIEFLCKVGAKKLDIDLKDKVYSKRYKREIDLIVSKGFQDYFLIVADIVRKAKSKMLVGPGRGSSGGSLVCYLLGITSGIDPIKFDLLFERFIDINRSDLPDIDIDFPDNKRDSVIKQLQKDYGEEKVKHIANISTMQPKITINECAKLLNIAPYETENFKNAIVKRFAGDERAQFQIIDTLEGTEHGKDFLAKFSAMKTAAQIEGHPRHSSVHAAGIIVSNEDVSKFAGINSRDKTAMITKKTAEYLNLLKIDILGLRTLSILEECANLAGFNYHDYYSLPLDDKKTFSIFNEMRISGIFQFEGHALSALTREMGIHSFEDIVALTSLARPGALHSGGASRYIKYRLGKAIPIFLGKEHKKITEKTFSIVVYQEQILQICREVGKMKWKDVNALRKILSRSLGKEYFNKYYKKFIKGAQKNGYSKDDARFIWGEIENSGAYAFNRSHAVAYSLISYWCASVKYLYPKEFVVASLNNAKDTESAIKLLRDMVLNENIEYIAIDPDESDKKWSINSKGIIVGSLLNIDGIGPVAANKIINARHGKEKLPDGIIKKLLNPVTDFDILFPCAHYWGDIYKNPQNYNLPCAPSQIIDVISEGTYLFIGKLIHKKVNDLNDYEHLQKRNSRVFEDCYLDLSLRFEDDTDTIFCKVDRYSYDEIGKELAENAIIDSDWFMIKGEIKSSYRYIQILQIMKLELKDMDNYCNE